MVERSASLEATVTALELVVAELQGRLDRARPGRLGRLVARLPANRQRREPPAPGWTPAHVALAERLDVVATALGASSEARGSLPEAIERFTAAVHESGLATETLAWCGAVAAFAAWPTDDELDGLSDAAALDGTNGLLEALWRELAARFRVGGAPLAGVEVMRDAAIADVTPTASHGEAGEAREARDVERVVRETAGRWSTEHGMKLVAWQHGERAPGLLSKDEAPGAALLPLGCSWFLPQPVDDERTERYRPFARAGVARHLSAVVYDTIGATAAETLPPGSAGRYAAFLDAARHFDLLLAASESVASEYRGLAEMLPALGLAGPRIVPCPLPSRFEGPAPPDAWAEYAAELWPLVIGPGRPEPGPPAMGPPPEASKRPDRELADRAASGRPRRAGRPRRRAGRPRRRAGTDRWRSAAPARPGDYGAVRPARQARGLGGPPPHHLPRLGARSARGEAFGDR